MTDSTRDSSRTKLASNGIWLIGVMLLAAPGALALVGFAGMAVVHSLGPETVALARWDTDFWGLTQLAVVAPVTTPLCLLAYFTGRAGRPRLARRWAAIATIAAVVGSLGFWAGILTPVR